MLLLLALALLLPASASAAGFGALPALPVSGTASCLRPTGVPGEVAGWAPDGVELIQATRSGFSASSTVHVGETLSICPSVAAQPGGAGVLAARTYGAIGTAFRDPGAGWSAPVKVPTADGHFVEHLSTAVDPRGGAVVAWTESVLRGHRLARRVLVARRPAGGQLGAPVELVPPRVGTDADVRVGMQADGTAVVVWAEPHPRLDYRFVAFAAIAPPGAPFGPPQLLADDVEASPSLAVAPDGRALAVLTEDGRTAVHERAPGGAFAPAALLGRADIFDDRPAVALRPDGAAIVAWTDYETGRILAARRTGPGPFGPPEPVGPVPERRFGAEIPLIDLDGHAPQAAFTGDGRAVVTWGTIHTLGNLNWVAAAAAALPGAPQSLGGPLRDAESVTPVILADGTPAVVWSDVAPDGRSLLHLAPDAAAPAAQAPFPGVRIGTVRHVGQGLTVPVRCSAACDVRASVPGGATGALSLARAGAARLRIDAEYDPIRVVRPGSVAVRVLSGPPGAVSVRARTVTARLRPAGLPRLRGPRAVRRAGRIIVTWRTERRVRDADFLVHATATRSTVDGLPDDIVLGDGRRSFRADLGRGTEGRFVQLYVQTRRDATERRVAVVRIRNGRSPT